MVKYPDTKVTIYFDSRSAKKDGGQPIKLRLYHGGKERHLNTGMSCVKELWIYGNLKNTEYRKSIERGEIRFVSTKHPNSKRFNNELQKLYAAALDFVTTYAKQLHMKSIDEVRELLLEAKEHPDTPLDQLNKKNSTLCEAFHKKIQEAKKGEDLGTARVYKTALKVFQDFLFSEFGDNDIVLGEINEEFLRDFEQYCKSGKRGKNGEGMKPNSISVHLRCLRHIINRAIKDKDEMVKRSDYPFENYTLPKNKTEKRAITPEMVTAIRELDVSPFSPTWHHRNYWLFMFNNMGMNLMDLAFLKRKQIENGRLKYSRLKTRGKAVFDIALTDEALEILHHYEYQHQQQEELVFPFMKDLYGKHSWEYVFNTYKNRVGDHNKFMKKIAKAIGLEGSLTSYVARHTWASIGFELSESLDVVGQGLGHSSDPKVTKVYAKDLQKGRLDEVNKRITRRRM